MIARKLQIAILCVLAIFTIGILTSSVRAMPFIGSTRAIPDGLDGYFNGYYWVIKDPISIVHSGSSTVFEGLASVGSFSFNVTVEWDTPRLVNTVTVKMEEKSSFGITFAPQTLTFSSSHYQDQQVKLTVPISALSPNSYKIQIDAKVTVQSPSHPTVAGSETVNYFFTIDEPPKVYSLTISTSGSGTTNPTGVQYYHAGDTATVYAYPNVNAYFDHWVEDGKNVGSSDPISIEMCKPDECSNHTLVAYFGNNPTLTVIVESCDGSFNSYYLLNAQPESRFSQVTVMPTTVSGYGFNNFIVDGVNNTGSSVTVCMSTSHTIVEVFNPLPPPTYTLTVEMFCEKPAPYIYGYVIINGTTLLEYPNTMTTYGTTLNGTTVDVHAYIGSYNNGNPLTEFKFAGWFDANGNLITTNPDLELTITANTLVYAWYIPLA